MDAQSLLPPAGQRSRHWTKRVPLDSHWRWYAVDVRRKVAPEQTAIEMDPNDVRTLMRCGAGGLPLLMSHGEGARQATMEIKKMKLREMQSASDPGFWINAEQYAVHCADEEVVVQQAVEPDDQGNRQWRMIVRIHKDSILECKLRSSSLGWSTDMVALHSSPHALFEMGHQANTDDLPIHFTGLGGIPEDILMYTTRYERFTTRNEDYSLVPKGIFTTKEMSSGELPELKMEALYNEPAANGCVPAVTSLKEELFFDGDGEVAQAVADNIDGHYYARVVHKGWWFRTLLWTLFVATLNAVDKYNNLHMLVAIYDDHTHFIEPLAYGFNVVAFIVLLQAFCWALAKEDMQENVHRSDLTLSDRWSDLLMTTTQSFLYHLQVPSSVKELVIWLCPRGAVMGRAVAKVNGSRVTILTWPSKHHYLCDLEHGMHTLYMSLFCRDFFNMLIVLTLKWKKGMWTSEASLLVFLLPKLFSLGSTSHSMAANYFHRKQLVGWLHARVRDGSNGRLSEMQWKAVKRVINYHFHGKMPEEYAFYKHLAPTGCSAALMLVLLISSILTVWNALEDVS